MHVPLPARHAQPHATFLSGWLLAALFASAVAALLAVVLDDAGRVLRMSALAIMPPAAPSAEIAQLAEQAGMNQTARAIFYAAQPVIAERAEVVAHCHTPRAGQTVELGCLAADGRIYILHIDDPELAVEMSVVAAHETLHAAYALYTAPERQSLDAQLDAAAARVRDPRLAQLLQQYAVLEPGQRANELFALLGTEYTALDPALEAQYARYFSNRAAVTAGTARFQRAYAALDSTLKGLRSDIELLQRYLADSLGRGNTKAYKDAEPRYAAAIALYNRTIAQSDPFASNLGVRPLPAP